SSRSSSSSSSKEFTSRTYSSSCLRFRPSPNDPSFSRPTKLDLPLLDCGTNGWTLDPDYRVGLFAQRLSPIRCSGPDRARRALLDLEQLFLDRVDDRFHPRVQVQLLQDVADVVLD